MPGVLPPGKLPFDDPKIDTHECPCRVTYSYNAIPSGALESITLRLIRKRPKLQFTSFMTTFYDEKGICQIFSLDNQLVVQASHDKLLKEAENEILLMEQFFASLVRINRNIRPQKETEALLNRPYHLFGKVHQTPLFWTILHATNAIICFQ